MITTEDLRREAFGSLCRDCINKKYQIKLERKDCFYMHSPYLCRECREMRHIVAGITFSAKWKLLFGKKD